MKLSTVVLIWILAVIISFGIFSGLLWVVCWAFNWGFTWKMSIGVYAVVCILGMAFRNNSGRA